MPSQQFTYTRKQLDKLMKDVFEGGVNPASLPVDLYEATLMTLSSGVARGFGKGNLTNEMSDLLGHFDHNVGVFSAAKTHQQVADMTRALIDPDTGLKRSFSSFKSQAGEIFDQYNTNWLRTEYRTAFNQGLGARQWHEMQKGKEDLPVLRYETSGDERVRKEHVSLDNIVRHIDDPFWRQWFPPNGWNCRCDVTQHELGDVEFTSDDVLAGIDAPSKLFNGNPALDKVIFDPTHPYMSRVAERYKVQQAHNFHMPVPPKPKPVKTVKKAVAKALGEEMKPKGFDEVTGIKMPSGFWGLFKKEVFIKEVTGGSFHSAGTVNIGVGTRYPKGTDMMKKVVAHEFGHAFHFQHKMLVRRMPVDVHFEDMFVTHRRDSFGHGMKGEKRAAIIKKTNEAMTDKVKLNEIAKEAGIAWGTPMQKESLNVMYDVIGSFTNGKQGGGHSVKYYKQFSGYGGRAEVFAHMFDIGVNGDNPFLKALYPKLHEDMKKMYVTLTKKVQK